MAETLTRSQYVALNGFTVPIYYMCKCFERFMIPIIANVTGGLQDQMGFNFTEDDYLIQYLHPLPMNALVKVDSAGFGFVLMHRSVADKMRQHHGDIPFFNETGVGDKFVSEDINFFRRMNEAGVPLYAHTGATVKHIKRFSLDINYYNQIHEADSPTQA